MEEGNAICEYIAVSVLRCFCMLFTEKWWTHKFFNNILIPWACTQNNLICCKTKSLEELRNEGLTTRTWQCFLTVFPPEPVARPGQARHFLGCKVPMTVQHPVTTFGWNALGLVAEPSSQPVMHSQHSSCIWIAQMMKLARAGAQQWGNPENTLCSLAPILHQCCCIPCRQSLVWQRNKVTDIEKAL